MSTLELSRAAIDALVHRQNLKRAYRLAVSEHWSDEHWERLRVAAFEEWGVNWREEIGR